MEFVISEHKTMFCCRLLVSFVVFLHIINLNNKVIISIKLILKRRRCPFLTSTLMKKLLFFDFGQVIAAASSKKFQLRLLISDQFLAQLGWCVSNNAMNVLFQSLQTAVAYLERQAILHSSPKVSSNKLIASLAV